MIFDAAEAAPDAPPRLSWPPPPPLRLPQAWLEVETAVDMYKHTDALS